MMVDRAHGLGMAVVPVPCRDSKRSALPGAGSAVALAGMARQELSILDPKW